MVLTIAGRLMDRLARPSTHTEQPAVSPERQRLIDQIVTLNPTAAREYLDQFQDQSLKYYLNHLHATQEPRGRMAWGLRPAETPAATGRSRLDD